MALNAPRPFSGRPAHIANGSMGATCVLAPENDNVGTQNRRGAKAKATVLEAAADRNFREAQPYFAARETAKNGKLQFTTSVRASTIPRYFLYGEAPRDAAERFVAVEFLSERCKSQGWVIEPHSHPQFLQIIVVRRGGGVITLEGETRAFSSRSILTIPSLAVHGIAYEEGSEGWVVTVAESYAQDLQERAPELAEICGRPSHINNVDDDAAFWAIEASLERLREELIRDAPGHLIIAEAALLSLLVGVLRQYRALPDSFLFDVNARASALKRFTLAIEAHYKEHWNVARYCKELGLTEAKLRSVCASARGESPIKIINDRLLLEAKRSLAYTDTCVSQIAYALGFRDPSYFTRYFRKRMGQTPGHYREHNSRFRGRCSDVRERPRSVATAASKG